MIEDILDEYISKAKVYHSLVGSLYPSIAYAELVKLKESYTELGGDVSLLPYVSHPRESGHVQ